MLQDEIKNNMNVNGGGLAVNITGRWESNRHALARNNKYTFGEAAKELRLKRGGGFKVTATELLSIYRTLFGEPEWHHAGFLPKSYGGGMKKTYFLQAIPTPEEFAEWQAKAAAKRQEAAAQATREHSVAERRHAYADEHGTPFTRVTSKPEHSVVTTCEMNGKYGWFEVREHHNYSLPVYYTGWAFPTAEALNEYRSIR